jgi:hypothetical protein
MRLMTEVTLDTIYDGPEPAILMTPDGYSLIRKGDRYFNDALLEENGSSFQQLLDMHLELGGNDTKPTEGIGFPMSAHSADGTLLGRVTGYYNPGRDDLPDGDWIRPDRLASFLN